MTSHPIPTVEWLSDPIVELFRDDDGRMESAYIHVRRAPYARAVQPDSEHLVFLYLGHDGLPIGIRLLEPAVGAVGAEVVRRLLSAPEAATQGGEASSVCPPSMTIEQLDVVIHRLKEASERLPVPAVG